MRPRLSNVIDRIHDRFDRYVVTKRGKPEVVMMSIEDYEGLLETLEIQSDKMLMKRIKKAEKDLTLGKGVALEDFYRKLKIV